MKKLALAFPAFLGATLLSLSCFAAPETATKTFTLDVNQPTGGSCTGTPAGTLTLKATQTRNAGVGPLLVFFDATGTTDTAIAANFTAFQRVHYSWDFGDAGTSGTAKWLYGSAANANSRNSATGAVAAHLFVTQGVDTTYTVTVSATSGPVATRNSTSCQLTVRVYDPSGANGYPGNKTTCVAATTLPQPGVGLCPANAAVAQQPNFATAIASYQGSGKRVLFKCLDPFSGNNATMTGTNWSVGAYGGCEGTQSGRPVFNLGAGSGLGMSGSAADGRILDIDLEGTGVNGGGNAVQLGGNGLTYSSQITVSNVLSNGVHTSFYSYGGHENGFVQVVQTGMGTLIGSLLNSSGNQCLSGNPNGTTPWNCGSGPGPYNPALYPSVNYLAVLGSSFDGIGTDLGVGVTNGVETFRVSACRLCVLEDSTFKNANKVGAVFKFHNGQTGTQSMWIGQPTEFVEIADNLYTGISGAQLVEVSPENNVTDERQQKIVFERNLLLGSSTSSRLMWDVQNGTIRENACNSTATPGSAMCFQIVRRGCDWSGFTNTPACNSGASGAPVNADAPQFNDVYGNTCDGAVCIGFTNTGGLQGGRDSFAENNLMFKSGGGGTPVTDNGLRNTVVSNTTNANTGNDPGFVNTTSGSLSQLPDFVPTANYAGGATVDDYFDAAGLPRIVPYELGAYLHKATVAGTYKFFAGDAAMSVQYQHNTPLLTSCHPDVDALAAYPVPGGNAAQMYVGGWSWQALENGPDNNLITDAQTGSGQFAGFSSLILACYNYLQATIPGAHFGISIQAASTGNTYTAALITSRPWNTNGKIVPSDIALGTGLGTTPGQLVVPDSFGSSQTHTYPIAPIYAGSIYYGIQFNGPPTITQAAVPGPLVQYMTYAIPAWTNPGVNQRWINFWEALSLFQYTRAGQTYTLDTDPLVSYIFSNDEYSLAMLSGYNPHDCGSGVPPNCTAGATVTVNPPAFIGAADTPSNTNFFAAYTAWAKKTTGFFAHTLIGTAFLSAGFSAAHGNDTPANMSAYVNQNIGGATALSNIQGLAFSNSDTFGTFFISPYSGTCGLQGFIGAANASESNPGVCPGPYAITNVSLAGIAPFESQIQPFDYENGLPNGLGTGSGACPRGCTQAAVRAIAAAANNSFVQANIRIWSMGDVLIGIDTTAWITYVQPALVNPSPAITPFSTVRPTNLH